MTAKKKVKKTAARKKCSRPRRQTLICLINSLSKRVAVIERRFPSPIFPIETVQQQQIDGKIFTKEAVESRMMARYTKKSQWWKFWA